MRVQIRFRYRSVHRLLRRGWTAAQFAPGCIAVEKEGEEWPLIMQFVSVQSKPIDGWMRVVNEAGVIWAESADLLFHRLPKKAFPQKRPA